MEPLSDEELIVALRSGDTESLGVLAERWQQPLYRFVYRLVPRPDDAHDVCQETFLRILRKANRYRPGSRFSTWMYQIALNLCRDQQRRRRRWRRILAEDRGIDEGARPNPSAIDNDDPTRPIEARELSLALQRALSRIPRDQREVLVLKEYEGLKFREIAEILDCPESTVKSRLYYGLNGLRSALVRQGIRHP